MCLHLSRRVLESTSLVGIRLTAGIYRKRYISTDRNVMSAATLREQREEAQRRAVGAGGYNIRKTVPDYHTTSTLRREPAGRDRWHHPRTGCARYAASTTDAASSDLFRQSPMARQSFPRPCSPATRQKLSGKSHLPNVAASSSRSL